MIPAVGTGTVRRPRWWRPAIVAVALLLVGVVSIALGVRGGNHALPAPAPSRTAQRLAAVIPPTPRALSATRSVPTVLQIPAIGLDVPLITLGLGADGSVQVPDNIVQPGWFKLGPTPGQLGSAVILGHVDNYTGPGVFFGLRTLASGDRVYVTLTDGATVVFAVTSVAMYSKPQFPSARVYTSDGSSSLQLVTCGGVFDHGTGSYLSNVVVFTSLIAIIPGVSPAAAPATAPT